MQIASTATVRNTLLSSARRAVMHPCYATKLNTGSMRVGSALQQKPSGKIPTCNIAINIHPRLLDQFVPMNNGQSQYRLFQNSKDLAIPAAAERASDNGDRMEDLLCPLVVVSFYKFADFPDHAEMRSSLRELCEELHVSGGIILAPEGINGSICGTRQSVERVLEFIQADERFEGLRQTESPVGPEEEAIHHGHTSRSPLGAGEDAPFRWDHVRVKLKKEVVSLGMPEVSPAKTVGKYVNPKDWNALIRDPETIVVDVRNSYETRIGKFKGAIDPDTTAFREFPLWVEKHILGCQASDFLPVEDQKLLATEDPVNTLDEKATDQPALGTAQIPRRIAMYCTGGIRCEKATSFMISKGIAEVYHLEGGILKYLEEVPQSESLWEGECFVFDKRVSVEHGLKQGTYKLCYACKKPINDIDIQSPEWEDGVSCPYCYRIKSEEEKARARARQQQFKMWGVVGGPDKGVHPVQGKGKMEKRGPFSFSRSL